MPLFTKYAHRRSSQRYRGTTIDVDSEVTNSSTKSRATEYSEMMDIEAVVSESSSKEEHHQALY